MLTTSFSGRCPKGRFVVFADIKDTQKANAVLNRLSKAGQFNEAMQVLERVDSSHIQIYRQTYSALLQVCGFFFFLNVTLLL